MWKTFSALALLALAGCAKPVPPPPELPAGQDFSISAALSTNQIRIGDPVHLTLTALHRADTAVAFPNLASGKDIIVREAKTESEAFTNGLRRTVQNIHLTSMTVTNHIIGEKAFILLSTPAGVRSNAVPFLSLEVATSRKPGDESIRPDIEEDLAHWPVPILRRILFALATLALFAAAFLALRKFLLTPRTFMHLPPPVPPYQIALEALTALRAKGWIEELNIEPFYVALSGIVRRYIEARFGLRAPERTKEEFIRDALTSRKLSDAHQSLVAGFLEQSDLVKFARHAPGRADMHNALDSAERLVHETMPAPTTAQPAAETAPTTPPTSGGTA